MGHKSSKWKHLNKTADFKYCKRCLRNRRGRAEAHRRREAINPAAIPAFAPDLINN